MLLFISPEYIDLKNIFCSSVSEVQIALQAPREALIRSKSPWCTFAHNILTWQNNACWPKCHSAASQHRHCHAQVWSSNDRANSCQRLTGWNGEWSISERWYSLRGADNEPGGSRQLRGVQCSFPTCWYQEVMRACRWDSSTSRESSPHRSWGERTCPVEHKLDLA